MVLVLLPGATFRMGARVPTARDGPDTPNADPHADTGEGPPHEVTLAPFLISKYEMTQGQWQQFSGTNPSFYGPHSAFGDKVHDLSHPVEQVSWHDCHETLHCLGLTLPTEAQWEYASRGGTTTVWWTGDDKRAIRDAANLADSFAKANRGERSFVYDLDFDDGYTMHAPVGTYRANPYGLHDTMGNVWEWCLDWYGGYHYKVTAGAGERLIPDNFGKAKACRGGGFLLDASFLRSAYRELQAANVRGSFIGVRPALNLAKGE
ncbi:MAG: formylglycine-generating enzyme family protein [Planctomycetota bacterium]